MRKSLTLRISYLLAFTYITVGSSFCQDTVCHPTFAEIFNFNVGDKFNYITVFSYWDGISLFGHYERYSMEITDKINNGDTTMYLITGAIPPSIALGNYCNKEDLSCEKQIRDTLILIDSVSHYLNFCPDSSPIISIPEYDSIMAYIDVRNYNDDTIYSKCAHNFQWYTDEGSWANSIFNSDHYDEYYAARMGLIKLNSLFHEAMFDTYLENCIISGETIIVNVVTDIPEPIISEMEEFILYPNPAGEHLTVTINSGIPIKSITIRTINGVSVKAETYTENSCRINMNIADIPKGLYLLEISSGNSIVNQLLMHH
jgi:hypothetical protein